MNREQAQAEIKEAQKALWALVREGASKEKKQEARRLLLAKQWQLFEITRRVDDMPYTADSGC